MHAHAWLLGIEPSVMLQVLYDLHPEVEVEVAAREETEETEVAKVLLLEQNKPESVVFWQVSTPHKQEFLLMTVPTVCVHGKTSLQVLIDL